MARAFPPSALGSPKIITRNWCVETQKHSFQGLRNNLRFLFNGSTLDALTHHSVRYDAILSGKVGGVLLADSLESGMELEASQVL